MATKYTLNVYLEFDASAVRDTAYTKIKTAMANVKTTDAWALGSLTKSEITKPDSSQETV